MGYNTQEFDWPAIRLRYEQGETIYSIAKSLEETGPTKQAIMYRRDKEGWLRQDVVALDYDEILGKEVTEYQDERKVLVVKALSEGKSLKTAAAYAGISDDTLLRWRKDGGFGSLCLRAKAFHLGRHEESISEQGLRGDWKASAYLLERDPLTKEQYQPRQEGPQTAVQINIGIDRDEVKIG